MKYEKLMKETSKGQIIPIPKTMDAQIIKYQNAHKLRFPSEPKIKKPDLFVKMALIGLDAFIKECKSLIQEVKDYKSKK